MGHTKGQSKKGKGIAIDQSDEPTSPVAKKQKKQQSHEEGAASQQKSKQKGTRKPTPQERMSKLNKIDILQTKWADHQLLKTLGIFEDVQAMFRNMGLEGLFNMSHITHELQTKQFLASLVFIDDNSLEMEDENRGMLTFKIGGREYSITIAQLGAIFSFPTNGEVQYFGVTREEGNRMWSLIARGDFDKGMSKGGMIRHPAIRYVHKFLAHTLYARQETGAVHEEEMALIIEGLKPYVKNNLNEREFRGLPRPVSLAHVLANRFLFYQNYASTTKKDKPSISIGGLITPILLACKVPLGGSQTSAQPQFIDAHYLAQSYYLAGRIGNTYGYKFSLDYDVERVIIFPKHGSTTIFHQENIPFKPQRMILFDPLRDGRLTTLKLSRKAPQYQRAQEDEEEEQEEVMGFKRYEFEPYAEPIKDKALRKAHEHIGMLKRLTKWQNKQIKKLVKTVKKQGKLIKKILKKESNSSPREEGEGSHMDMRVAEPSPPLSPDSQGSGNMDYSMDSGSPLPSP